MSSIYLYYPLLISLVFVLAILVRRGWRWYLARELKILALLVLVVMGMRRSDDVLILILSWALFLMLETLPQWLLVWASNLVAAGKVSQARRFYNLAPFLFWGKPGRAQQCYGRFLDACAQGDVKSAETFFAQLLALNPPPTIRRELVASQMLGYAMARQWQQVTDLFEPNPTIGSKRAQVQARLAALRAYAELGQLDKALLCLESVAQSALASEFSLPTFTSKAILFALAGDLSRLQAFLQVNPGFLRRLPRAFAPYWMGRCHLCRGESNMAKQFLQRALVLSPPGNAFHRAVMQEYVAQADSGAATPTTLPETYERTLAETARKENATADFRLLVARGRPGPITWTLLSVLALIFLATWLNPHVDIEALFKRFGNLAQPVRNGESWRLLAAMLLHAGWLHLGMNSLALYVIGRPAERYYGAARFLVIFFGAGIAGNLISNYAWPGREVAVGASGGITGLLGAVLVAFARVRWPALRPVRNKICTFLVAIIILQTIIDFNEPQFDKVAHLAGIISGMVLGFVLSFRRKENE